MRRLLTWLSIGALARQVISLPDSRDSSRDVRVHWVGDTPGYTSGTTFGLPWPQGELQYNETSFIVSGKSEEPIPLQSWVTGYWRDGSIKWTGHAIPPLKKPEKEYTVTASLSQKSADVESHTPSIKVVNNTDEVVVGTGNITVSFPKQGSNVVNSVKSSQGKVVGRNGKLVLHSQSAITETVASRVNTFVEYLNFESHVKEVSVSKDNSVRALVTVHGDHRATNGNHSDWLQFALRFYLYANSDTIRIVHTIVFDGKAEENFINGLGIQFGVPLKGEELYNRHVRIAGLKDGFLRESVQGITGLRRDPGEDVRTAQFEGKQAPNASTWDTQVSSRLQWLPTWNDYKLSQHSSDGFTLKKRTKSGQGWIKIPAGTRSEGLAYLGGATKGGLAIGLRDFWKRYPTGIDIANAGSDQGQVTLWLYSPDAGPLDLRPFHDGLGLDTYAKQTDALEITYEDYEPGFNTPYGISRTSEVFLRAFDTTPPGDELSRFNTIISEPPILAAEPQYIKETKAAGSYWEPSNTSSQNSNSTAIESHLDFLVRFYQSQVEYRRWYGFLDYGDFMHTYDEDRHTWRYDIGGYAWDNSELSPDLFLWQYFLRSGRADIYRLAEALTRHTSEVDVYHFGKWKGLGTRHGVQHFGDSGKQVRIAQPQYRKYFYYLSGGDERVGELLQEALDADKTYGILDPQRKVRDEGWKPEPGQPAAIWLGTDWAGLAAGWLIEWERRGPSWEEARDKITGTAQGIANLTNGFVTGSGLYAINNGTLLPPPTDPDNRGEVSVSHLNAVFGLPEVVSELLEYWGSEAPTRFKDVWLDYCYYYGATGEEQKARYGEAFSQISLVQGHSRLTAYFANQRHNATVADRAWDEFYAPSDPEGFTEDEPWAVNQVNGSVVLVPVEEATWITTNIVAQYGLAAIQNLALVGNVLR